MKLDEELIQFILEELDRQDKTKSGLARHLKKHPSQVTRLLHPKRAEDGKGTKQSAELTVRDLGKIFEYLELDFSPDIFVSRRKVSVKLAPLRGTVAHGVWREREMLPKSTIKEIPFPDVPEFSHLEQYAYQVIDSHGEHFVPQDGLILCVQFSGARSEPKNGDIVVIERQTTLPAATRNVIATERALRKVVIEKGRIILRPLTSDKQVDEIVYDPTSPNVRIAELVIGWISLSPNTVI